METLRIYLDQEPTATVSPTPQKEVLTECLTLERELQHRLSLCEKRHTTDSRLLKKASFISKYNIKLYF